MNRNIGIAIVLALLVAIGGAWWWRHAAAHRHSLEKRTDADGKTYYTCSMHPQVRQDGPGKCPVCGMPLVRRAHAAITGAAPLYWYDPMRPDQHFDAPGPSPFMDMPLVPRYAEPSGGAGDGAVVRIDPRMAQNLGLRTALAQRGAFTQGVEAVGRVALDERRIVTVESRVAGWIETLDVAAEGDAVSKGQRLAALYSPELFAARQEQKLAQASGDAALAEASRQRLRLLGGGTGSGSQSGVFAPASGFVLELLAREGAQLAPGTPLMRIADLAQVWVLVDVPESLAGAVRVDGAAQARLRSVPGKTFGGRVDYLYPQLDAMTRTLRARLVFDNAGGLLRPGMFADVTLSGEAQRDVVRVPSEAVIRTGTRTVVMVAEGEGRYRPAQVEAGVEHNDETVILSGLRAGEAVVVSGQFLIDSEASLLGAYQRIGGPREAAPRMPEMPEVPARPAPPEPAP
ncbi:MAG: efflux RND transporter periplasmic adaptor subunit [Panacagrimonas sp.]